MTPVFHQPLRRRLRQLARLEGIKIGEELAKLAVVLHRHGAQLAHVAEDLNGDNSSNVARVNLFLEDPGTVTLIHGGDALDERGAEYLFLRYLEKGGDEGPPLWLPE